MISDGDACAITIGRYLEVLQKTGFGYARGGRSTTVVGDCKRITA
jgi:hypothetical protein